LDDYLTSPFNDSRNGTREEFVCTFRFPSRSDAERVIDWLRDGILKSGCVWDLEAEALEQPEGTYRIAAALTKGGQMYRIG
jgi:hypothetical protein